MADFNQITLAGRLVSDPELRHTTSGMAVAEYSIAVNRRIDAETNETLYIGCLTWGKQAETVSRYLAKGSSVLVSGYLKQENWTTKQGDKRSTYKVVTNVVQFLSAKRDQGQPQPEEPASPSYNGHRYPKSDVPNVPPPSADTHVEDFKNDIPF
jgi:single-strand DNA-binding protein